MSGICIDRRVVYVILLVLQTSCALDKDISTNNVSLERTKRSPFLDKLFGIGGSFDIGLGGYFDASLGAGASSNRGYGYRGGYGGGYGAGYGRSYNQGYDGGYNGAYSGSYGNGYSAGYYRPNDGYNYNRAYNNGDRYATSYQTGYQQTSQPNYIILVAQPATSVNYATAQAPVQVQPASNSWAYSSSQAASQSATYNTNYSPSSGNLPTVTTDCT